jgi:hypothetical protein
MAESKNRRVYESAMSMKSVIAKSANPSIPPLEEITPARYARLNANQRRELLNRLIEYLKSI